MCGIVSPRRRNMEAFYCFPIISHQSLLIFLPLMVQIGEFSMLAGFPFTFQISDVEIGVVE